MGAKCCARPKTTESVHGSKVTVANLMAQVTELNETTREETIDVVGTSEQEPPNPTSGASQVDDVRTSEQEPPNPNSGASQVDDVRTSEQEPPNPNSGPSQVDDVRTSEQEPPNPISGPSQVVETLGSVAQGSQEETSNTQDGYRASNILWSTGSFSDPIPNGFYCVIPDDRFKLYTSIPTLSELHALGDQSLISNVIIINFPNDKKIFRLKELVATLVGGTNKNQVTIIKKITGVVRDAYKGSKSQIKVKKSLVRHDFPLLGKVTQGSCRARALLFKILADSIGLPSRIVMGFPSDLNSSASVDSYNHISVVVNLDGEEMLVDLVRAQDQIIPLSVKAIHMTHFSPAVNNSSSSPSEPHVATEIGESSEQLTVSSSCQLHGPGEKETKSIMKSLTTAPETGDEFISSPQALKESMEQNRVLEERGDDDSSSHSPK